MTGARPWLPSTSLLVVMAAWAVVATRFDPYTDPVRVATALPCLVAALAVATGRGRSIGSPAAGSSRLGLGGWAVLLGVLATFQLGLYLSAPRDRHPTLSSLSAAAFDTGGVRAVAFAFWLYVGWYLVRR